MLEIRYTKPDPAPWIDLIFAPVFWLIAYSIIWNQDPDIDISPASPGFWLFIAIIFLGLQNFINGLINWRSNRVGRIYCRIDEDGIHFFDRVWYKAWSWGEVDFIAWQNIETIVREPWAFMFTPKSWTRRFMRYLVHSSRISLLPIINRQLGDKKLEDIWQTIREIAPETLIRSEKTGL